MPDFPFTPGPYSVHPYSEIQGKRTLVSEGKTFEAAAITIGAGRKILGEVTYYSDIAGYPRIDNEAEMRSVAALWIAAPALAEALRELVDVFAHDGENSVERFERLAAMFRKDTGYLAPGKDQPMCGPDQPDGDELRAIYDAWYQAKIDRARAALSLLNPEPTPAIEVVS